MAIEVIEDATARFLLSLTKRRPGEAARILTDLSYYMDLKGLGDKYLKLFSHLIDEAERHLPRVSFVSFAESLNRILDKMSEGSEYTMMSGTIDGMIEVKAKRLGPLLAPPEEVKRKAGEIVSKVIK